MFTAAVNLSHEFSSGFNRGSPAGTVRFSRIMNEALNVSLKPPSGSFVTRSGCFFINGFERWGRKLHLKGVRLLLENEGDLACLHAFF